MNECLNAKLRFVRADQRSEVWQLVWRLRRCSFRVFFMLSFFNEVRIIRISWMRHIKQVLIELSRCKVVS